MEQCCSSCGCNSGKLSKPRKQSVREMVINSSVLRQLLPPMKQEGVRLCRKCGELYNYLASKNNS